MEYLYRDCFAKTGEYCSFCTNRAWTSPLPMKRIPQPIRDLEKPYHFKLVHETPTTDDNGEPQSADDFQPRANIKKLVSEGALSSKEEVEQFSRKFAVEPDLMKAYIAHMQDLNIKRNIGARSCIEKKSKTAQKTVEEYPWLELVQSGGIKNYSFQC